MVTLVDACMPTEPTTFSDWHSPQVISRRAKGCPLSSTISLHEENTEPEGPWVLARLLPGFRCWSYSDSCTSTEQVDWKGWYIQYPTGYLVALESSANSNGNGLSARGPTVLRTRLRSSRSARLLGC